MKKVFYTKKYFDKYGGGKTNYKQYATNPTFKKALAEIKNLGGSGNLLDIGCAQGFFLQEAQKTGFTIFGVDISKYIINQAKKNLNNKNLFVVDLTNQKLPFPKNKFDVVTLLDSLEHIENPQNALREVSRVMKPKGLLHIRLPGFFHGMKEPTHVNFYTTDSLKHLLGMHGFQVIELGQEGGRLQIPFGVLRLLKNRNTFFNFVPFGGKYISCYAKKI